MAAEELRIVIQDPGEPPGAGAAAPAPDAGRSMLGPAFQGGAPTGPSRSAGLFAGPSRPPGEDREAAARMAVEQAQRAKAEARERADREAAAERERRDKELADERQKRQASILSAGRIAQAAGVPGAASVAGLAAGVGNPALLAIQLAKEAARIAQDGVRMVGEGARSIAGLDTAGVARSFEGLAEKIPIVGGVFGEMGRQVRGFMTALDGTAANLAKYNGQLAVAQARAEVRQTLGDIRRGNLLAPELSKFVEARSRLEDKGQDLLAKLLVPLLPHATTLVNATLKTVELMETYLVPAAQAAMKTTEDTASFSSDILKGMTAGLIDLRGVHTELKKTNEDNKVNPLDQFLALNLDDALPKFDGPDTPPVGGNRLNVPAFKGF